eukprot:COSAG01_NODE_4659_length_4842_cov_92.367489_5_plen_101_part_00
MLLAVRGGGPTWHVAATHSIGGDARAASGYDTMLLVGIPSSTLTGTPLSLFDLSVQLYSCTSKVQQLRATARSQQALTADSESVSPSQNSDSERTITGRL